MSRLIAALETDKHRAPVMLAYGAGLRASEACKLCIPFERWGARLSMRAVTLLVWEPGAGNALTGWITDDDSQLRT